MDAIPTTSGSLSEIGASAYTKENFWSAQLGLWRARESDLITGVWTSGRQVAEPLRLLEVTKGAKRHWR